MGVKWTMSFLGLGNKNDSSIHCNVFFFFPIQQRSRKLWNCFCCNEFPLLWWHRGCPCTLHWLEALLTAYCAVMFYSLLNKKKLQQNAFGSQFVWFSFVFFELEFFVCSPLFYCESWSLSWIEIQCLYSYLSHLSLLHALDWQIRELNSTIWSYFKPCVISIHSKPHGTRLSVWESLWVIS